MQQTAHTGTLPQRKAGPCTAAPPTHHLRSRSGPDGKLFGITMALIGVLIALCSAMVGSERTELSRSMIHQTQAHSSYTGASTKFRLIMLELEKQRSRPASALNPARPSPALERFIALAGDYKAESRLSKAWSESYDPIIEAHFDAAEAYEKAQVIAEIAIVLASLAVLLSSRAAWLLSVLLTLACMIQLVRVYLPTRHSVQKALPEVQRADDAYANLRKAHGGEGEDENIIELLDPHGNFRAKYTLKAVFPSAASRKEPR